MLNNVTVGMKHLENECGVVVHSIDSNMIVQGQEKATLNVLWAMLHTITAAQLDVFVETEEKGLASIPEDGSSSEKIVKTSSVGVGHSKKVSSLDTKGGKTSLRQKLMYWTQSLTASIDIEVRDFRERFIYLILLHFKLVFLTEKLSVC